jgi:hypothetical protein
MPGDSSSGTLVLERGKKGFDEKTCGLLMVTSRTHGAVFLEHM